MKHSLSLQRLPCLLLLLAAGFEDKARVTSSAVAFRSFDFLVCNLRQSLVNITTVQPATSVLECVERCAKHPTCRSVTFCKQGMTRTCFLSSSSFSCSVLSPAQDCSHVYMIDSCLHGGTFDKATVVCNCPLGWQGNICQNPVSATHTTVTTTTIVTTSIATPDTTYSGGCLTDATCATASPQITKYKVTYCCPSGYNHISTSTVNGVVICTCS